MSIRDSIEREMILAAPIERVWGALTAEEELATWFGAEATVDLRVGGEILFGWEKDRVRAVIEVLDPPRTFAYRWQAHTNRVDMPVGEGPSTLVTFMLEPAGEKTRLRLVETGFASLPEEIRAQKLKDNEGGWTAELGELVEYLEQMPVER